MRTMLISTPPRLIVYFPTVDRTQLFLYQYKYMYTIRNYNEYYKRQNAMIYVKNQTTFSCLNFNLTDLILYYLRDNWIIISWLSTLKPILHVFCGRKNFSRITMIIIISRILHVVVKPIMPTHLNLNHIKGLLCTRSNPSIIFKANLKSSCF